MWTDSGRGWPTGLVPNSGPECYELKSSLFVRVRLHRVLVLGWILVVLAAAAVVVWYVLRGGAVRDQPNRAQVSGTLLGAVVIVPPVIVWAWSHWPRTSLEEGGRGRVGGRVWSRYGRRYRRWVLASSTFVDVKGLATAGDHTPRLEEVFVDVALVARAPHAVSADPLAGIREDASERHSIQMFLGRREPVVLAVVGPPGCGKTTLLTHVARCTARLTRHNPRAERRGRRIVPVLLALRDHASAVTSDPEVTLPTVVRAAVGGLPVSEPAGWWDRQLRRGRCLLLLDGLDEVARERDRRAIADWVEKQVDRYPGNHFVITSRPHGYRSARIRQANVVTIQPFTPEQVRRFLHGWYLATERSATGARREEMPAVRMRATTAAEDLIERLRRAPALVDLTVNPLLLTMIANVHRYRGALPGTRADLYGEICQVMLSRRIQAKNLPEQLPWSIKEKLLGLLAFQMMTRHVRDLPHVEVVKILAPGLGRVRQRVTGADFLADAVSNGLLVEREHNLYAFAHLTFQEYLAACHIQANNLLEALTTAVEDDWWRETTLLYAAAADADPVVQACLDNGSITALALAFHCSTGEHALAPELRDRLNQTLHTAFTDDADPAHRRFVAAVLAARLTQQTVTTTAGTRICARPVPANLYWLFLQDTHAPVPDGPCLPETDGIIPVTGVWGREALSFVSWLNEITTEAGQSRYRLPTKTELTDQTVLDALGPHFAGPQPVTCLWTYPSDASSPVANPSPWHPPGQPDPHQISGLTLQHIIATDTTTTRVLLLQQLTTAATLARLRDHLRTLDLRGALACGLDRDLDRILVPALALALVRGLDRDLGLVRGRVRGLDLVRGRVRSLARGLARGLDRDLGLARDLVLARGRDLDRALDRALDLGLGLGLDRARVLARARVLDLARDLDRDLDLARDLGLDRDLALARARALDLDLARARVLDLDRARARARALDRDLARARVLDLDRALARARALDLDLARARVLDLDRDLARARVLDLDRDLARDLALVLDRVRGLDRALDLDLVLDLDRALIRARDSDRNAHDVLRAVASWSMGHPLGIAFSQAATTAAPSERGRRFATALMAAAGIEDQTRITVTFDGSLSDRVQSACRLRREDAEPRSDAGWNVALVDDRLADFATQMLDQKIYSSTGSFAARTCIAALALIEDNDDDGQTAQTFRELAATAALLEQRAKGEAAVGESVVLALA
jgi:hypothetical protein